MRAAVIPEPIAELQHQLDEFRSTQPGRRKLPESLWQAASPHPPGSGWPASTVCIPSHVRYGWTIWG